MSNIAFDGISPYEIYRRCMDIKDSVLFAEGPLNFEESHIWNIGRDVFRKLHTLDNGSFDERRQTFVGIDVKINYNDPYVLSLEKKQKQQVYVNFNPLPPSCLENLLKAANNLRKGFEEAFMFSLKDTKIKKVIFNDPVTIVIWDDGTKTIVKAQNGEVFDKEKGLAMAVVKKAFGNNGNYYNEFKKWIPEE